jgi:histidinol-phosphate aminotransferase
MRAAIAESEYIARYVEEALQARDMIGDGLQRLGIRYYPSQGNFVLFDVGARSVEVRDALREKGILVRDRSYEIAGCVRVTAGTREQAGRFLEELERIW